MAHLHHVRILPRAHRRQLQRHRRAADSRRRVPVRERAARVSCARVLAAVVALALVVLAPAAARTVKYGGTLVVGINNDPGSLDPTNTTTSNAAGIDLAMCLSLYDFEQNHGVDEYVPVLAAAPPQISPDKLSYTVKLKSGILFNDGTPLNAQAVVASVQRFMTYPGSNITSDFASVASVSASGQFTVVYHMKRRDAAFIGNAPVLSPAALAAEGASFSADPVCAGPFMLDHTVAGDSVTLVKSPYWYKRAAIHLDKIVYKVIARCRTRLRPRSRPATSRCSNTVAPTALAAIQDNPGFRVLEQSVLGWQGVFINIGNQNGVGNLPYQNVGTPLASSAKLRQAFEEAINRPLLNKVVFAGLDVPSCTPVAPANTAWYAVDRGSRARRTIPTRRAASSSPPPATRTRPSTCWPRTARPPSSRRSSSRPRRRRSGSTS